MPTVFVYLGALFRMLSRDERGNTTEHIIWIAGLAAIALAVLAIWGPAIMQAVAKVKFSP
jgi:hypothetical protein